MARKPAITLTHFGKFLQGSQLSDFEIEIPLVGQLGIVGVSREKVESNQTEPHPLNESPLSRLLFSTERPLGESLVESVCVT
jgi:hypothetical protein